MSRVILPARNARIIRDDARAAFPFECCGLLTGTRADGAVTVTGVHASTNVTERDRKRGFEIDPKLRFDLMRETEARGDGTEIVGHYHSHPEGPAEPSATDLAMAYEREFVWLICAVADGEPGALNAFRPNADGSGFDPLDIVDE